MGENLESKLYKVLRLKIKNMERDSIDNTIKMIVKDKNIKKSKTLIKDNEVIRIIKTLDLENNNTIDDGYIFIKDIISMTMKVSDYEKSNGYLKMTYEKEFETYTFQTTILYKRLLASSGNVRSKKVIFIRENLWEKANDILLCGMPSNMEYDFFSKFNAYYALPNTDSDVVTMPKIVVINDYEKDIMENFDIVREIGRNKYKVDNNKPHTERIKPFDGAGLVDVSLVKESWMKDLNINYIPSAFQFRCIAGIKGNVYTFDIKQYAIEHKKTHITDAWGEKRPIFDEKGNLLINMILTKSQFKFFKKFKSFKEWVDNFNTVVHGYKRTFNVSHYSVCYDKIKDKTLLSYQPLQSLNLNESQIESICKETVDTIKNISTNVDEFLKYRGLLEEVNEDGEVIQNNDTLIPPYYKALQQNKNLFYDKYIQEKVQEDIKGFKERTYKGCIFTQGNYQTLIPDIVGLAEFAFGAEEPQGCLKANEVYSRYWLVNKVNKVGIVRFPHIAREWRIGNVINPKTDYLRYMSEGIVTSMFDTIALALNSADFDGDKILTISTSDLVQQALEEMANTITFIPLKKRRIYNVEDLVKKVPSRKIPLRERKKRKSRKKYKISINEPKNSTIDNMDKTIKTDCMGMSNNIGDVVNKISKLWMLMGSAKNEEEKEKIYDYIKIMSVIGSLTIDFVKTGVKAPVPKEIEEYLKKVKKPIFMKVKYKNQAKNENKINKNNKILKTEPVELFSDIDCTMNRIYHYMMKKVSKIKLDTEGNIEVEFTNLMNDKNRNIYNATYKKVFKRLIELKAEYDDISESNVHDKEFSQDKQTDKEYQYRIFYSYCKQELMNLCGNKEVLLDYLIHMHYINKNFILNNDSKALLWNCFGSELNMRIQGKELTKVVNNEDKINEKVDKLKDNIKKIKSNQEKVYIKQFHRFKDDGKEDIKDIEIYESELKYIKHEVIGYEKRKILFILLMLKKFNVAYNNSEAFKIFIGKKDVINKNHILKLADVNHKKYEDILIVLNGLKFVELYGDKTGKILNCKVKEIDKTGEKHIINDINECRKYLIKFK